MLFSLPHLPPESKNKKCIIKKLCTLDSKKEKINKQKPQLNRLPEGGALTPCDQNSPGGRQILFLAQTQSMKSHGLLAY